MFSVARGLVLAIALLVTGVAVFTGDEEAVVHLVRETVTASTSPTQTFDVVVNTEAPINVVSGSILFPHDVLEVSIVDNDDSFVNVWLTEPTVDETAGTVTFAGGTNAPGGLEDQGVIFSLRVTSLSEEPAELVVSDLEIFGSDGQGTAVKAIGRSYTINEAPVAPEPENTTGAGGFAATPVDQSDLNGDGKVTISDLSILIVKTVDSYNSEYDLNSDGRVGIGDISVLLTELGE